MTSIFRKVGAACALAAAVALATLPAQAQILAGNNQPNFKSLIDNGNFNILARGGTSVGTITTTAKYFWDRWAGASGTSTTATITNVTSSLPSQFTNAAQVQRNSGQTGVVKTCAAGLMEMNVREMPASDPSNAARGVILRI